MVYRRRRAVGYNAYMSTITDKDLLRDPLGILRRVEHGEALLVVRDEQPVAEIKPACATARRPRPYGLCAGQFTVPDGFDQALPEDMLRSFEEV
jgi:antitoxin (DNA-binding transcriptional repressor) of toxin-antitoxin stability system